ncbi:MAG: Mpo1-like protein, partial [Ginsengibacter sp.]
MLKVFFRELNAFYPAYLKAHSDLGNQVLHFIGSIFFYNFLILAFI